MPWFLLSIFSVSIEMISLFQLLGATRLFLEKVIFISSILLSNGKKKKIFQMNGSGC